MPKRRANGEGNIRKRKDGRWEGRYTVGHDPETGKAIIKNVLGKTQAEVKEKLKKAIEENVGIDYGRAKTYTVGSWLEVWMENYARVKLRPSTFKTSQGFLKNHIKPQIGSIQLADLTSLDLQRFYKHLLDGGRVDRIVICAGCPIFVYGGAISALPGAFSLVTAVRFSNGQEALSIVYSGAKYTRFPPKIAAVQRALF